MTKLTKSEIRTVRELLEDGRDELVIQEYFKKELNKKIAVAKIYEIKNKYDIKIKSKSVPKPKGDTVFVPIKNAEGMPKEKVPVISSKLTKKQLEQLKKEGFFNIKDFGEKLGTFLAGIGLSGLFALGAWILVEASFALFNLVDGSNAGFIDTMGFFITFVLGIICGIISVVFFCIAFSWGVEDE